VSVDRFFCIVCDRVSFRVGQFNVTLICEEKNRIVLSLSVFLFPGKQKNDIVVRRERERENEVCSL
jgi:hypothetical protein